MSNTENDFSMKMISDASQLSNALPTVALDATLVTDDYIILSENDEYHDHILNLLKIKNNPNLNKFYYQFIQKIKKSLLIDTDFSAQDDITKKIEQELVPTDIFKKRMKLIQCLQKILHLPTTSNIASSPSPTWSCTSKSKNSSKSPKA